MKNCCFCKLVTCIMIDVFCETYFIIFGHVVQLYAYFAHLCLLTCFVNFQFQMLSRFRQIVMVCCNPQWRYKYIILRSDKINIRVCWATPNIQWFDTFDVVSLSQHVKILILSPQPSKLKLQGKSRYRFKKKKLMLVQLHREEKKSQGKVQAQLQERYSSKMHKQAEKNDGHAYEELRQTKKRSE